MSVPTATVGMVIGDVVAGAAVLGVWAGYFSPVLSDIACAMAITYYIVQFCRWLRRNRK